MRIDVITIFPEYFGVLDVSLLGRARTSGMLDIRVHDLRDFTHDRHRTVDDTPYGGGAGMVMRAEPWGEALDAVLADEGGSDDVTLIVPSPAGSLFTQRMARSLAAAPRLVFACGRYEGVDQRVVDHFGERVRVREVSLGDYVLNGGEVAALAMIEAVARLVPGVVGNPDSLIQESHEDGLLEYPSYTKPATWRGLDVPEVLLSGHHAEIARWRREQQLERTARMRPDLPAGGGLMRSARVWLWVVLLAAAACVCVSIVGWISTVGGLWFWEPTLFGAVSALFVLPGFAVSLAVDAILLHLRRPAPVRTAEAVLLIVVLAVVAALLLVGQWEPLFGWEFVLWPAGILAAIAVSVVLGVGNGLAREQPGSADLADRAFGTPPA